MKNILIPTDFSANAWNALRYATDLFKNDKVNFYLLNAFQVPYYTTDSMMVPEPGQWGYDQAQNDSETKLQELLFRVESDKKPGHHFKTLSTYNNPTEAISLMTEKYKIKLIIMGTRGENEALDKVYGTHAMTVMKKVHRCPVLVIPQQCNYDHSGKKELVFSTDFKDNYKKKNLKILLEIAKKYSASLRILYIQESGKLMTSEQEENKETLQDYIKGVSHSFHTLTKIEVGAGIHSFVQSRGSHMLAIINKKPGFFDHLFSTSVLEEIGRQPEIPVLVLQDWNNGNG